MITRAVLEGYLAHLVPRDQHRTRASVTSRLSGASSKLPDDGTFLSTSLPMRASTTTTYRAVRRSSSIYHRRRDGKARVDRALALLPDDTTRHLVIVSSRPASGQATPVVLRRLSRSRQHGLAVPALLQRQGTPSRSCPSRTEQQRRSEPSRRRLAEPRPDRRGCSQRRGQIRRSPPVHLQRVAPAPLPLPRGHRPT